MVKFLFWNLNKQPRADVVAQIVQHHNVDVVILAECDLSDKAILGALNKKTNQIFCKPWSQSSKIQIFTRFPERVLQPVFDDPLERLTIRRMVVGKKDILLAAVHFQSKVNWSSDDQRDEVHNLAQEIIRIENDRGHQRTVLVGDLNMNPFEPGVVSSHSLHAVMTKNLAKGGGRTVAGREYPFFYNPMWGFFGDRTNGPPGTHYYRAGKPIMYFWNMFDQVLIRPDLLDLFHDDLRILDSDGKNSLLTKTGLPKKAAGSDHLPILFELDLM